MLLEYAYNCSIHTFAKIVPAIKEQFLNTNYIISRLFTQHLVTLMSDNSQFGKFRRQL